EGNPVTGASGTFRGALEWLLTILKHLSEIPNSNHVLREPPQVTQGSATELPYPDHFFDAIFTDPPYYDNVPYSYLSDFFYVWLKRSIGHLFPEFFVTPLTPKSKEIVAYSQKEGGLEAGKKFFENMLSKSFQEIYRTLKPNGIVVIVYAHKSFAGWETVINSLLNSGLVVTASWPVHTEMKARLNARETASLSSSIYIVARKMEQKAIELFANVLSELQSFMKEKLDLLWNEGISGADFFISAIGAGIEVFGKYKQILDLEGNEIKAAQMLEEIRKITTDYAVHKILHNGFAREINALTRFYLLYRWQYKNAAIIFDEARKLALSLGLDLNLYFNKSFIQKQKELVYLLSPTEREELELKNSNELIEVLHHVLLLWKQGKQEEMLKRLKESGYGTSDIFFRVAQAISETLDNQDEEKQLLDGFLIGKQRIQSKVQDFQKEQTLFNQE
ncbi:MAG: hypothetical protein N3A69_03175, partial [Leptospiraceae bacterium]|nr:hypothetical protein [Leptospiraceae bacterium]